MWQNVNSLLLIEDQTMGGESEVASVMVLKKEVEYLSRSQQKTENKVEEIDSKVDRILQFMAGQEQRNSNAEKERDRIFKASTLLPVAILTSVISGTVSYMFKTAPIPKAPEAPAYMITSRDQKVTDFLKLDREEK